jgi:hypothetical protein
VEQAANNSDGVVTNGPSQQMRKQSASVRDGPTRRQSVMPASYGVMNKILSYGHTNALRKRSDFPTGLELRDRAALR